MVRIGELLVSLSACPPEAVQEALQNQRFFGARLGTNLLEMGAVDEADLAEALARLHRIPTVCGEIVVDPRALALVPRRLIEKHDVVPYTVDGRTLNVLVSDPRDTQGIDEVAFASGKRVRVALAPEARVWSLIRRNYGIQRATRGVEDDQRRRWAPRVYPAHRSFAEPLAADVWSASSIVAHRGETEEDGALPPSLRVDRRGHPTRRRWA